MPLSSFTKCVAKSMKLMIRKTLTDVLSHIDVYFLGHCWLRVEKLHAVAVLPFLFRVQCYYSVFVV